MATLALQFRVVKLWVYVLNVVVGGASKSGLHLSEGHKNGWKYTGNLVRPQNEEKWTHILSCNKLGTTEQGGMDVWVTEAVDRCQPIIPLKFIHFSQSQCLVGSTAKLYIINDIYSPSATLFINPLGTQITSRAKRRKGETGISWTRRVLP